MTETIVVSSNSTVVVDGKKPVVVLSGQMGPRGPSSSISIMSDVDLIELKDKSLLVYDVDSQKWKASKKLEDHLVNAGFF